jgi:hypothetical protein
MGAHEVVVCVLEREAGLEPFILFREGECLSAQRRVFLAQGQVEPLDEARSDLAVIDFMGVAKDHSPLDGYEPAALPVLHDLDVAEVW